VIVWGDKIGSRLFEQGEERKKHFFSSFHDVALPPREGNSNTYGTHMGGTSGEPAQLGFEHALRY